MMQARMSASLPTVTGIPKETQKVWEHKVRAFVDAYCHGELDTQSCMGKLEKLACQLHQELTIHPCYQEALEAASRFSPKPLRPWGWLPLIQAPLLRIGLLAVHRSKSIPLHDHPNSCGVQQVISGQVRIRQYRHTEKSSQAGTIVSLEEISDSSLTKGQATSFTPALGNLHQVESEAPLSIMADILINPYQERQRAWYYMVPFSQHGGRGLYNRISKQAKRVS